MPRNLDMTALRSFIAVADAGGVTRASGLLNLTQSAVSMQIKRLEENLGQDFFSRAQRKLTLTPEGEQLLSYARRMLALNDEARAYYASAFAFIWPGVFVTLQVTFFAYILALIIGLLVGLLRLSTNPVIFNLATVYVEVLSLIHISEPTRPY